MPAAIGTRLSHVGVVLDEVWLQSLSLCLCLEITRNKVKIMFASLQVTPVPAANVTPSRTWALKFASIPDAPVPAVTGLCQLEHTQTTQTSINQPLIKQQRESTQT